ncbi:hypothetical protein HDU76_008201, partial [Blyttiomyces sp. JEL0837]
MNFLIGVIAATSSLIGFVAAAPIVDTTTSNVKTQYSYGKSDVSVVNTFTYERPVAKVSQEALQDYSFEVQIAVRHFVFKNNAFPKDIGIKYTNDSGVTFYEAQAEYSGILDEVSHSDVDKGFDLWTVTIERGPIWFSDPAVHAQYEVIAYASFNGGERVWDPKGNRKIYKHHRSNSSIERRNVPTQYPYGSSDISVVNSFTHEKQIFTADDISLSDYSFDVQIAVRHFAFKNNILQKDIRIRYTNDSGLNYYEAPAQYKGILDQVPHSDYDRGYDLWSVTIERGVYWNFQPEAKTQYEITAWASFNGGERVWDNTTHTI